jgi:hypothetical protein
VVGDWVLLFVKLRNAVAFFISSSVLYTCRVQHPLNISMIYYPLVLVYSIVQYQAIKKAHKASIPWYVIWSAVLYRLERDTY